MDIELRRRRRSISSKKHKSIHSASSSFIIPSFYPHFIHIFTAILLIKILHIFIQFLIDSPPSFLSPNSFLAASKSLFPSSLNYLFFLLLSIFCRCFFLLILNQLNTKNDATSSNLVHPHKIVASQQKNVIDLAHPPIIFICKFCCAFCAFQPKYIHSFIIKGIHPSSSSRLVDSRTKLN